MQVEVFNNTMQLLSRFLGQTGALWICSDRHRCHDEMMVIVTMTVASII